jgi:hypothetical protein
LRPDALGASRILDLGESGNRLMLAKGTVFTHLKSDHIALRIAPGWHVNAHKPGQDWLIGAAMTGADANWPTGKPLEAGFSNVPINVYDGELTIPIDGATEGQIEMTLQVCSDEICLEPETATFRLP